MLAFEKKQRETQAAGASKQKMFEPEYTVSLVFATKKIPEKASNKPITMYARGHSVSHALWVLGSEPSHYSVCLCLPLFSHCSPLAHSLYNHDGVEVCLFARDPQSDTSKLLEEAPVARVSEVIGLTKLRKNYHQFEDKRTLCQKYQLFLADDRITPMLPPLIGKYFFDRKKQPIAVRFGKSAAAMRHALEQARDSTAMFVSAGPSFMVKVGSHRLSAQQIADNIAHAVPHIVDHVPGAWKNIESISLKTATSIALPMWNSLENTGLVSVRQHAHASADKPAVAAAATATAAPTPAAKSAKSAKSAPVAAATSAPASTKKVSAASAKKDKAAKEQPAEIEMDDASFEQMLADSGLEVPDDEQGDMDDDEDEDEEEAAKPVAKGAKKKAAAAAAVPAVATGARVAKSAAIGAASEARADIAARPKSKVAAAKAAAKETKGAATKKK